MACIRSTNIGNYRIMCSLSRLLLTSVFGDCWRIKNTAEKILDSNNFLTTVTKFYRGFAKLTTARKHIACLTEMLPVSSKSNFDTNKKLLVFCKTHTIRKQYRQSIRPKKLLCFWLPFVPKNPRS